MPRGTLFLVVGPSGSGKDSLIDGARRALAGDAGVVFARRAVTRAAAMGVERHDALDSAAFARRLREGGFMLSWRAHGHHYGLPGALALELERGCHVVANVSRTVIAEAAARFVPLIVIHVGAAETLRAARLAARGREDAAERAARLARAGLAYELPAGVRRIDIVNDGTLAEGIAALVAALTGER